MPNTFLIGSYVRIQAAFRDSAGTLVNPTTVVLKVTNPAGGSTNPSLTHPSTGVYYADYTLVGATAGTYTYKFTGSGAVVAVNEDTFNVVATAT